MHQEKFTEFLTLNQVKEKLRNIAPLTTQNVKKVGETAVNRNTSLSMNPNW